MATTLTPNMSLPVPGVGTEAGPDYSTDINNCLSIVDAHDHTPGSGVQITPSAININADLLLNGNNLTTARSLRLSAQSAALNLSTDLGCLYEVGVDLYYNDGIGNQVRITQSGAVAGTPGSISNLVSPASASYSAGSKTFTWQSDALTPANLDAGSVIIRNVLASSEGVTVSVPSPLAASYTMTLPTAPPASTLPLSMSSAGALSAAQITQAQIVSSVVQKFTTAPTSQKFITGSGTYTTPTSPAPLYLRVRAVGAGGGGTGNLPAAAGAGGDTTFGSSLITCTGGGAAINSAAGAGGTGAATGLSGTILDGSRGQGAPLAAAIFAQGGNGGSSPFGGAGGGGAGNAVGNAATANTGSGGGGAGNFNNGFPGGAGGGSGGYVDVLIPSPSATYAYSVGAAGTAGANGGGAGAAGYIIVEEFYC